MRLLNRTALGCQLAVDSLRITTKHIQAPRRARSRHGSSSAVGLMQPAIRPEELTMLMLHTAIVPSVLNHLPSFASSLSLSQQNGQFFHLSLGAFERPSFPFQLRLFRFPSSASPTPIQVIYCSVHMSFSGHSYAMRPAVTLQFLPFYLGLIRCILPKKRRGCVCVFARMGGCLDFDGIALNR